MRREEHARRNRGRERADSISVFLASLGTGSPSGIYQNTSCWALLGKFLIQLDLGRCLRICSFQDFPGNADAAGSETKLKEPLGLGNG